MAILITYLKAANFLDNDVNKAIFADGDNNVVEMIILGSVSMIIYLCGMFFVKEVQFEDKYKEAITKNDKTGTLIYVVIAVIFLFLYGTLDILLDSKISGIILIFVVIIVNFLVTIVNYLWGNKDFLLVNQGKGPAPARASTGEQKPKRDFKLG